jgi:L-rhamnose mutarotase
MRRLLPLAVIAILLASCSAPPRQPQRFGSVIGLRAEKAEEYKRLHQAVWPDVVKAVHDANIRNYSIYLQRLPDGNLYLFSYLEYIGTDHAADMRKLAENPKIKEWWTLTDPCQQPLAGRKPGEWWSGMEEVSHQD